MQFGLGFIYLREYLSVTAVPITVLPLPIGRYEKENHESLPFSIQRLHSRTPILVRQPTHRIQRSPSTWTLAGGYGPGNSPRKMCGTAGTWRRKKTIVPIHMGTISISARLQSCNRWAAAAWIFCCCRKNREWCMRSIPGIAADKRYGDFRQ